MREEKPPKVFQGTKIGLPYSQSVMFIESFKEVFTRSTHAELAEKGDGCKTSVSSYPRKLEIASLGLFGKAHSK
jgi:hypothetical protein